MFKRTFVTTLIVFAALEPTEAWAHDPPLFYFEEPGPVDVRAVGWSLAAGWAPLDSIQLGAEISLATGHDDDQLFFPTTTMWFFGARVDATLPLDDGDEQLDVSAVAGYHWESLVSATISGGLMLRTTNGVRPGPSLRLSLGIAETASLYGAIAVLVREDDVDVVGSFGLELRRFPRLSTVSTKK